MSAKSAISARFTSGQPIFSVEFFPPKNDEAGERMLLAAEKLRPHQPAFASITYGAGGGTRATTLKYAKLLKDRCGFEVMPHLTCVGHTKDELLEILAEFDQAGLHDVMALRGDPPKGETEFRPVPGGFSHADELVSLIRAHHPHFGIGVAGYPEKHPEAPDVSDDVRRLAHKVSCGADFVTTQLFFDNTAYFRFVERCREAGVTVPILPGLLPILSLAQARRFCDMCGARIPPELENLLVQAAEEDAPRIGADWAYRQVDELLRGGAPGFHLYVLNKSKAATRILEGLASN